MEQCHIFSYLHNVGQTSGNVTTMVEWNAFILQRPSNTCVLLCFWHWDALGDLRDSNMVIYSYIVTNHKFQLMLFRASHKQTLPGTRSQRPQAAKGFPPGGVFLNPKLQLS